MKHRAIRCKGAGPFMWITAHSWLHEARERENKRESKREKDTGEREGERKLSGQMGITVQYGFI